MIRIENIIAEFKEYTNSQVDCAPIQKSYVLAARTSSYFKILGSSYLQYALEVAQVLIDLKLDIQSIVSGLLHEGEATVAGHAEDIRSDSRKVGTFSYQGGAGGFVPFPSARKAVQKNQSLYRWKSDAASGRSRPYYRRDSPIDAEVRNRRGGAGKDQASLLALPKVRGL